MKLLDYKKAAEILDCSPSTVQKLCLTPSSDQIPIVKIGNETRIDEEDLAAWIRRRKHFHEKKNCRDSNGKQPLPTEETTIARS